jgi:antitoxin component of MazEF toxin-antitoxin module
MVKKVIKIGSSAGIILNKTALAELGLKVGDQIEVKINPKKRVGTLSAKKDLKPAVEHAELREWTKKFTKRYGPALKELADK